MSKGGSKVVVIGGGIVGCMTAWRLKQQGAEPVILERGRIGHESSWAGAGILSPINPWLYPDAFTRLVEASLTLYPSLQRELETLTGISSEWFRSGLLVPLFNDDTVDHREPALAWSARFGWQVEELDTAAALAAEPALSDDVAGALLWPQVGQVRNPRLLKALHRALSDAGVEMVEQAVVDELIRKDGRATGVRMVDGREIAADAVLLAAGSWSGDLATQSGFRLPVEPVKGQIVLLRGESGVLRHIVKHDAAYFVPRRDGRILVGASMENVGFRGGNTVAEVHRLLQATLRIAPHLCDLEIERQWMGFRPGSPDGLPFLGPVESLPGLWVASGHYRNGVVLAPVTAELISRWILGEAPSLDMTPFRPERNVEASGSLGYPSR